jgi:hypothetical protein
MGKLESMFSAVPDDLILIKFEETKMGKSTNGMYDQYARSVLKDRRPDAPFFEADRDFKKDSNEIFNVRFGGLGSRYRETPNHPDLFLADTTKDPRAVAGLPDLFRMRPMVERRAKEMAKKMRSQDTQQNERRMTARRMDNMKREVFRRQKNAMNRDKNFFGHTFNNQRAHNNVVMSEDTNALQIFEPTEKTINYNNVAVNSPFRVGSQTAEAGMNVNSMSSQMMGDSSNNKNKFQGIRGDTIKGQQQNVTSQNFVESLQGANKKTPQTPSDIAAIYNSIESTQMLANSNVGFNTRQGFKGDTVSMYQNSIQSEKFIVGPDGLVVRQTAIPTGTIAGQGQIGSQPVIGMFSTGKNKTGFTGDKEVSAVSKYQTLQPTVDTTIASKIAKMMVSSDQSTVHQIAMDIQHSGVGFQGENGSIRLVKGMIPVINNNKLLTSGEHSVSAPEVMQTAGFNAKGYVVSGQQQKIGMTVYQPIEDNTNTAINKKYMMPQFDKSRLDNFEANNDDLFNEQHSYSTGSKRNLHKRRTKYMEQLNDDDLTQENFSSRLRI